MPPAHSEPATLRRRVFALVPSFGLLVLALAATCAPAAEPKIDVKAFFSNPEYGLVRLSPSGRYLGALVPGERQRLAIIDLDAGKTNIAAAIDGDDVASFRWVNDDRLIFTVADLQAGLGEQTGGGLFAINRDGTEFRELAPTLKKLRDSGRFVYRYTQPLAILEDGSDDIVVVANDASEEHSDAYRLNTRTGRRTLLTAGKPGDVQSWIADARGEVRAAVAVEKGTRTHVYWRATGDGAWVEIGSYRMGDAQIVPVGFDADGSLIVAADLGRDTAAVYRYDPQKKTLGDLLAAHPQADLGHDLVRDAKTHRIVGLHYEADRPGSVWFDVEWARVQKTVDAALPDHFNRLMRRGSRFLIDSFSDRDPGTYYLLDLDKRRLEPVAIRRKAIDPAKMPKREPVRYAARDGLEIPGYLTLPPGKEAKDLPLVLYVHGGPWVRGAHWRWSAEPAYLASLGYAVLEPEFRGSTGWGRKLFVSSFKQWGRSMQDDLDDGMDWLVHRGIVARDRTCIMGASYGGYAVMMGLAREPDRFRCGVDYVGVTDINLMFDVTWSDFARGDFIKYAAKDMIGDPDTEGERLAAVSPLRNAAKIKRPVLMAYGAVDFRVPLVHGTRMRDALEARGTPVEWVVYTEEGHGFLLEANRYDFYERVDRFLAKHLGSP